jgi:hypothetical protein
LAVSLALFTVTGCSIGKRAQSPTNSQPTGPTQQPIQQKTDAARRPQAEPGVFSVGEASGSYTAKGETVPLQFAYAGHARRFGSDSIVVLLTDRPIPPQAVAEEIKSQTMLLGEKVRGLEYAIDKDGYWVRFHPGQYQESKGGALKEFSIENDTVKGRDEDAGDLTNGKYARSVRFAATVIK